jgi:hypothetical protein
MCEIWYNSCWEHSTIPLLTLTPNNHNNSGPLETRSKLPVIFKVHPQRKPQAKIMYVLCTSTYTVRVASTTKYLNISLKFFLDFWKATVMKKSSQTQTTIQHPWKPCRTPQKISMPIQPNPFESVRIIYSSQGSGWTVRLWGILALSRTADHSVYC